MDDYGFHAAMRRFSLVGLLGSAVLFGALGIWANLLTIQGAVIAHGRIAVESQSKEVQHPTGGVVASIHVANGDFVREGSVLMRLDTTELATELETIEAFQFEWLAKAARLKAQIAGQATVRFDDKLLERASNPDIAAMMNDQAQLHSRQLSAFEARDNQLAKQIQQFEQVVSGLQAQLKGTSQQLELLEDELAGLEELYEQGLADRPRLLGIKREIARAKSESGHIESEIGRINVRASEIELRRFELREEAMVTALGELREAKAKIAELDERRGASSVRLARSEIRAPNSGFVHELAANTVGGVVAPRETIMQIVPTDKRLLVEARVRPQDIDQVQLDGTALLRFTNADNRLTPQIKGYVAGISADLQHDESGRQNHYLVTLQPEDDYSALLGELELKPGMPVEAFIQTTARTPMAYLVQPLGNQLNRAFREK